MPTALTSDKAQFHGFIKLALVHKLLRLAHNGGWSAKINLDILIKEQQAKETPPIHNTGGAFL